MQPSTTSSLPVNARPRARHRWFPLLVIALLALWWLRRSVTVEYTTLYHFIAALVSAILVSGWFIEYGRGEYRRRLLFVGVGWLALAVWFVLMKPVYNGDMGFYRWRPRFSTAADRLLGGIAGNAEATDWQTTSHDYPRFLGTGYWAEAKGVSLQTNWKAHPPQEMWRREIGAGWSGFAVVGNYAVTQEQRGDQELVSCYRVDNGDVVWTHSDTTRFDPEDFSGGLGDVGPRATPTIHDGKVFTQGGTGMVNCLDARTGRVLWSHDTITETGADVIIWGKAGSPLVVDDMVIISVGAPNDPAARENFNSSLIAYGLVTGDVRWAVGNRKASYASPLVATLAGERQIVMVNENYVTAHRVSDGTVLWEHPWADENDTNASATQPIPLVGDRLLLTKGYGVGVSLLQISRDETGVYWARPIWNPPIKPVMKAKFANVVLRDGFVYGLDDVMLSCIELETGTVQWKKRRHPVFGHGQIMLIGNVILVLSESGELALVEASPQKYHELASIQALDPAGVTWNTPAFAPPYLLVRNAREAACYRLPIVDSSSSPQ